MSTTRVRIREGEKPTKDALKEVRSASNNKIVIDEESPEFSSEELKEMAEQAKVRKEKNRKQVVALRITPSTLERAKITGKGYTGFLSRLLDLAIEDPVLVQKALD